MPTQLIAERYDVIRPLGQGSFAHTLLARDRHEDRDVALKVLSLRDAGEWKTYELFEREAAVLRTLRHSGVPAIYDTFRAQWKEADAAWLAMEYIEGPTLAECIAESRTMDLAAIRRLFMEVLGVLEYLHTRVPPVLHRDIKPANIILRSGGAIALVDFGSVRHVVRRPDEAGSTVAGTSSQGGYGIWRALAFIAQTTRPLGKRRRRSRACTSTRRTRRWSQTAR
jgi:serine/threonine protein kinase